MSTSTHQKHSRHPHVIRASVVAFVTARAAKAQEVSRRTRIPASVLLAQACEESSFGRQAPDNAYVGIKGQSASSRSAVHATHEVVAGGSIEESDSFRACKDFDEAADDYADFLVNHPRVFANAFAHVDDPIAFARAIGSSGDATNPKYGENLVKIMKTNRREQHDIGAGRTAAPPASAAPR